MSETALMKAAQAQNLTLQATTGQEKKDHTGTMVITSTGQPPDHPASIAYWTVALPAYFGSTVYFLLDDQRKLQQITLIMPREKCVPFGQAMVAADGQPVFNKVINQPGGFIITEWQSKQGDDIGFTWAYPLPGSPLMDATCESTWTAHVKGTKWLNQ